MKRASNLSEAKSSHIPGIIMIGTGGLALETTWLIDRINQQQPTWRIEGYIDPVREVGSPFLRSTVLGDDAYLDALNCEMNVVLAIGSCAKRKELTERFSTNKFLRFPALVDPSAILSDEVTLGRGVLVGARSGLTVDVHVGDFALIDIGCTVSHNTSIGAFSSLRPGAHLAGAVSVGNESEIGLGAQVIQGVHVGSTCTVGAGAVVIRNVDDGMTVVGVPAKPLKR